MKKKKFFSFNKTKKKNELFKLFQKERIKKIIQRRRLKKKKKKTSAETNEMGCN